MQPGYYEKNKENWRTKYKAKNKEWRRRNKEHLADYQRRYFSAPGARKRASEWRRKWAARNIEHNLLNAARRTAKVKGLPFNIVLSDIVIPAACPVLGIELQRVGGARTHNSPSIDRIVPSLGYVKGNVIVVSWRANRLKADASREELRKLFEFYCVK